jgi:cytochrome c-type biogenesis protein CcmF
MFIPEIGKFALILALCFAVLQATIPLLGAHYSKLSWMRLAKFTALGQFLFIGLSFFILAYCFITNDFSVAYVAENSNRQLPVIYRFCAVWGAHEGSLLLWVFILSIWMSAVSFFNKNLPEDFIARVLAVLGMITFGFLYFLLSTSDPFVRLIPFPTTGQDLNPLLQDPGLVIHPPMLYMGYVGFSVAFAFAIAALISGRLDAAWARWSRPWTIIAWCFLTLGITLGSWWAYRELGWGGWWFWDPVENASFLPWLVGTALIHSLLVTEKRHAFKVWTVLLAICAFSLSLLGTFLVRSGVLISVHAFATDPARGAFMLKFLALVIGGSLVLYAWRAQRIRGEANFRLLSRETLLLLNNVFLVVAMITVLLGTLYPLIIETLGLGKISVGSPYFNWVFIPLMTPFLFLMGVGPQVYWQEMSLTKLVRRLWLVLLVSFAIPAFLLISIAHHLPITVLVGLALAFWILITTFNSIRMNKKLSRSQWGMVLAHIGVAVTLIGIVLTSHYSLERDVRMAPGDELTIANYKLQFLGTIDVNGSNYKGVEAGILVSKAGKIITLLKPQQRLFNVQQVALAKPAINANLFRDLYVALGEPIDDKAWAFRIYYKPFVRWIWLGGLLMLLGGVFAATDRRYRIKILAKSITTKLSPNS